jgi:hypothetical protein
VAELANIPAGGGIQSPGQVEIPKTDPAIAALGQFGAGMEALSNHIYQMRRITQSNLAMSHADQSIEDIRESVSADPNFRDNPMAAAEEVRRRFNTNTLPQLQKNFPLAWHDQTLTRDTQALVEKHARIAYNEAHGASEQNARDENESALPMAVDQFVNRDNPKPFGDWVQQQDQLVKMGLYTRGEADLALTKAHHQVALGMFQRDAMKDPSHVLGLTDPPAGITAQELESSQRMAFDHLTTAQRMVEATLGNARAQTEMTIAQNMGEIPADSDLETARAHGMVSEDFYEAYSGHRFIPQSDKGVYDALQYGIDGGFADRGSVLAAVANGTVSPKDAALFYNQIEKRDKVQKGTMESRQYEDWGKLQQAIRDNVFADPGTLSIAHTDFMARFKDPKIKTPEDVDKFTDELMNKYAPKKATVPASPAKAAIAAKLKLAGATP